jgi:PAS domain-containing protein
MTEQLADAREPGAARRDELESARTHLQTILDNLTAGVIVFDAEGRIDTVNPGATRILRCRCRPTAASPLSDVPELLAFAPGRVAQRFELLRPSPEAGERDHWQEFDLRVALPGNRARAPDPAGARRRAAARRAAAGVRRHHRGGVGAARRPLERGGAPPGARDQEPAHADPAVGRTPAAQAAGQARWPATKACCSARWPPSWPRCRR